MPDRVGESHAVHDLKRKLLVNMRRHVDPISDVSFGTVTQRREETVCSDNPPAVCLGQGDLHGVPCCNSLLHSADVGRVALGIMCVPGVGQIAHGGGGDVHSTTLDLMHDALQTS